MAFFVRYRKSVLFWIILLLAPATAFAVTYSHTQEFSYTTMATPTEPLFFDARTESIAIHPTNSNIIYRGGWGSGVMKSTDGGRTWTYKNNGLPTRYVESVTLDPSNPNTVYAGLTGHIWAGSAIAYRSTNGGDYWEPISGILNYDPAVNVVNPCGTGGQVEVDPTDSQRIYVGITVNACNVRGALCGGIYRSADGGNTFGPNPGCSPSRPPDRTKYWPDNDVEAIRIDPQSTNIIYMTPVHNEGITLGTSFDYGDTVRYMDVADTRGTFLPPNEQYVMSLRLDSPLELAPSDSDTRYGLHGGGLVKRRSDNMVDPYGTFSTGSGLWTIPVSSVLMRFGGAQSQSATDGVDDNDADGDPARDNVWKPIFTPASLPSLGAPSPYYTTAYTMNTFAIDREDPNKIYLATFGYYSSASYPNYTINIWELTPNVSDPNGAWNFRSIYELKPTYPSVNRIWSMKIDPSDPHRIFFIEKSVDYLNNFLYPHSPSDFKVLESSDNGATWPSRTLSSGYTYFHAMDIKEFELSNSTRKIFLGSTQRLYVYNGSSWTPKSYTGVSPQGSTFLGFTQSPLDPDVIYVKGPRYVARTENGDWFNQFDEIGFGLGEYYPNAQPPDSCIGPTAWTDPVLTTTVFNALAAHPAEADTLYAGADNGLWRNRNARWDGKYCYGPNSIVGASRAWEKIPTSGLGSTYIWSLKFDPADATGNTLWAGTRNGLYKSLDGGLSWLPALANIRDIKQMEFSGDVVLLASLDGLYRSADHGDSWQRMLSSQINYISERSGFPGNWLAATNNGMLRSVDGGQTWSAFSTAFSGQVDAVLYTSSPTGLERAYYTGKGDALYRTDATVCGNGVIEIGEQCEGTNFGSPPASCTSLGYQIGTLACDPVICTFDTSSCGTDIAPPVRSNPVPASNFSSGTTLVDVGIQTDEAATCRYGTYPDTTYQNLPYIFDTTGAQVHYSTISVLDGQTYYYYVRCRDAFNNANTTDFPISFSVGVGPSTDFDPPVVSNGQPSGTLPAGTVETTMGVSTGENAHCRYSRTPDVVYADMTGAFDTANNLDHVTDIYLLRNGTTYNFYVRCEDTTSNFNQNTNDYPISFSVGGVQGQTCGNGVIEGTEQCDGGNLNGATCSLLGQGTGSLGCDPLRCRYDTSGCSGPTQSIFPRGVRYVSPLYDNGDNGLVEIGTDLKLIPDSGGLCPQGMVWVPQNRGFCIDRYENGTTGIDRTAAVNACSANGKYLPTDTEWWLAAAGTPDPATGSPCNVNAGGPVVSGSLLDCRAFSGAYDMIGNYAEWTSDTRNIALSDGYIASLDSGGFPLLRQVVTNITTAPFGDDYIWVSAQSGGIVRGGAWNDQGRAGRNALEVLSASATQNQSRTSPATPLGFRCVQK